MTRVCRKVVVPAGTLTFILISTLIIGITNSIDPASSASGTISGTQAALAQRINLSKVENDSTVTSGVKGTVFFTGADYGGGLYYHSIAAGIVDGSSGTPPPYQVITIRSGNHAASAYGDYIRDRPINGVGRIWVDSGYTLQGCSDASGVEPRFYAFRR